MQALRMAVKQRGAVLLAAIVMLTLAAVSVTSLVAHDSAMAQRDAEAELLFVGEQYRAAIESYWRSSPGRARQLPTRLEDLVADNRFPQPRRHLRKLFAEPVDASHEWDLIKVGASIVGVRSRSVKSPYRKVGFSEKQVGFESASSYSEWEFRFDTRTGQQHATPGAGGSTPAGPAVNRRP